MREFLGWMVEQLCRPIDTKVLAVVTVEDPDGQPYPGLYRGA